MDRRMHSAEFSRTVALHRMGGSHLIPRGIRRTGRVTYQASQLGASRAEDSSRVSVGPLFRPARNLAGLAPDCLAGGELSKSSARQWAAVSVSADLQREMKGSKAISACVATPPILAFSGLIGANPQQRGRKFREKVFGIRRNRGQTAPSAPRRRSSDVQTGACRAAARAHRDQRRVHRGVRGEHVAVALDALA